jgi:hypothetical protein
MSLWKIVYQSVPYNSTSPRALIVEAETQEAAYIVAYDHLTRTGIAVSASSARLDLGISDRILQAGGVDFSSGDCHVRTIEPYAPKVAGKVVV